MVVNKKNTKEHKMLTEALYTVPEAAAQLRLSPWTLWDLMKIGKLTRTKVAGRTFIRESELQKLIVDTRKAAQPVRRKKATTTSER
jgi:hypothetical protein